MEGGGGRRGRAINRNVAGWGYFDVCQSSQDLRLKRCAAISGRQVISVLVT